MKRSDLTKAVLLLLLTVAIICLIIPWNVGQTRPSPTPQAVDLPFPSALPESVIDDCLVSSAPPTASAPSPDPKRQQLQQLLDQVSNCGNGIWALHIEPLAHPSVSTVSVAPDNPMISASIIKLFIMATVYDHIQQSILDHDSCYPLIYSMITISDNYATNELICLLGSGDTAEGMNEVNRYAAAIGCRGTTLKRLMLADSDLENYTTVSDCAHILRMIYEGTCVSSDWSAEMLSILKHQAVNNRLPANIPDVVIAHKTGDLTGLCCADVGIVYTSAGDYILCAICNYPDNDYAAAQSIAALSDNIYQMFIN